MKIVVFGAGGESALAVHNLLVNISKYIVKNDENIQISLIGFGEKNDIISLFDRCNLFTIKDPFKKGNFNVYRIFRKVAKLFKIDSPLISSNYIVRKTIKRINWDKIDYIFAASGCFYYFDAALKIGKKFNKKVNLMYFDPFTKNITAINENKRFRIEKKWYEKSNKILLDMDDSNLPFDDCYKKVSYFKIPIFEKNSVISQNGSIVYGGSLYNFRKINSLDDLICRGLNSNESFDFYTGGTQTKEGVNFHNFVSKKEYEMVLEKSKAIIVIGNDDANCVPSKLFEAIAFKKPIILVNFKNNEILQSPYPLFFDCNDPNLFERINDSYKNFDNFKIDLYSYFFDRNPSELVKVFFDSLKEKK